MHIKSITSQHRRDFTAVYACEHCSHEYSGSGYDDDYFHRAVLPERSCPECHKKAGAEYRPLAPKYAEGQQV